MEILKKQFFVRSSDGVHNLAGMILFPEGEAKGFFHIVHGMTEHIARYEKLMYDLAELGWICFGYDNLGHGNTAADEGELGYIAPQNGWDLLARDVKLYSDAVIGQYGKDGKDGKDGKEGMPYCLMGHSMGSFIVRLAAEKYVRPDRLIVMGTGGANPAAGAGLALIGGLKLFRGDRYISPMIEKMAFGSYNKRFGGGSAEDPSPWLTNDREVRKRYYSDRFCMFKFTVSAMGDLIRLMKYSNRGGWFKGLSRDIPVLLVSGEEDPVGGYGKGVRSVYAKLKKQDVDVKCILYKGARHEILNDFTYGDVVRDMVEFCE